MVEEKPVNMAVNRIVGPTGPRPPAAAPAVLTPKEVFGILRRHILLIIALTIVGLIVGGATWYLLRQYFPRYTAQTYIEVLPPVETDPMTIVAATVQKDIRYGYRLSIANLIKQQSTLMDLVGRDNVKRTDWFRRRGGDIRKAVKYLNKHLVAFAHRDSDFVEISMTCRSDREAALIVNEMLHLFLTSHGGVKRREVADRLARLEEQRGRVQRELDAAERALSEVAAATGITDLTRPRGHWFQHTYTVILNDLELGKNDLELALKQVQADIKNLEELATGPITVQIEYAIERDPVILLLAQQLVLLESELAGRLTRFGENHRVVRQTQELINEIEERKRSREIEIAEELRQSNLANAQDGLLVLQERFVELERLREEANAQKRDLDLARTQYEQREKVRDERLAMVDALKEQIEKLNIIHDDPDTPKVRSVGDAPEPLDMVTSRQWWLWFPSGTIFGFLFSVGLAFLIELANDLVRTPRDVGRFLHIPLLAVVPDAAEDDQVRGIELCHAVRQAPYSIISESYRRCRANLRLSGPAESLKTLLVGSGMTGDGTTSVAVNLATTFVAENKKVLLIDANFRRPSLQKLFPKVGDLEAGNFDFGLSSVLMNQCSHQDAIRSSGIEGLDIIDAGPQPSNPAELLGSPRMAELLKEQRKNYDHVIVDGPPLLLVSDAKVLANFVDATVLVFNAAATRRGAAQRTIRELREIGAAIVGCVLFGARSMKGGYFQEQFRSYQKYQKAQLASSVE